MEHRRVQYRPFEALVRRRESSLIATDEPEDEESRQRDEDQPLHRLAEEQGPGVLKEHGDRPVREEYPDPTQ